MNIRKEIKDAAKFIIPACAGAGLTMLFGPVPVAIGLCSLAVYANRREARVQQ